MRPTTFDEAYIKPLGAGDNPNTGDLPFCRAIDPNTKGPVFLISCWLLLEQEIEEIKKTGRIYVGVMAHPDAPTQPPICVMGNNPFTGYAEGNFIRIEEDAIIPYSKAWIALCDYVRGVLKAGADPYKDAHLEHTGINKGLIDIIIAHINTSYEEEKLVQERRGVNLDHALIDEHPLDLEGKHGGVGIVDKYAQDLSPTLSASAGAEPGTDAPHTAEIKKQKAIDRRETLDDGGTLDGPQISRKEQELKDGFDPLPW